MFPNTRENRVHPAGSRGAALYLSGLALLSGLVVLHPLLPPPPAPPAAAPPSARQVAKHQRFEAALQRYARRRAAADPAFEKSLPIDGTGDYGWAQIPPAE